MNARGQSAWPICVSTCADSGVGTWKLGEVYMVHNNVWEQAWAGRRKSWHKAPAAEILRIGCLEKRLGRTLMACDFLPPPVNDPSNPNASHRLLARPDEVIE